MTKQKVPEGLKSSSFQENPANEVYNTQYHLYTPVPFDTGHCVEVHCFIV